MATTLPRDSTMAPEAAWDSTVHNVAPPTTTAEAFCQELERLFPAVKDLGTKVKTLVLDPHGADTIEVMHTARLRDVADCVNAAGLLPSWSGNLARYILGPGKNFGQGIDPPEPSGDEDETNLDDLKARGKGGWNELAFPKNGPSLANQLGGFHKIKSLRLPPACMKQLRAHLCKAKPDVTAAYNVLFLFSVLAFDSGYIEGELKTRLASILHGLNQSISQHAHVVSIGTGFSNRRQGRYETGLLINTQDAARHAAALKRHSLASLKHPLRSITSAEVRTA